MWNRMLSFQQRNRLFKFIIIAFAGMFAVTPIISTTNALAIDNPNSVSINNIYVFRDVGETGDWLIYCRYNVDYTTIPDEPASETFEIAMYDTLGTTLIATRNLRYYQENITSLRFTAAQAVAAGLVWGSAYIIKVRGSPDIFALVEGVNQKTSTLSASSYFEQEEFTPRMLTEAEILQDNWGITLLSNGLLNSTGATYFTYAIPNFPEFAPDAMYSSAYYPSSDNVTFNTSYEESLHTHTGPRLEAAITDLANWLHVSEDWMAIWLVSIAYLVMAGIVYSVTKDPGVAMLVSITIPVGAAYLGVGLSCLTIMIAVGIITAVLFAIHFILGKFA